MRFAWTRYWWAMLDLICREDGMARAAGNVDWLLSLEAGTKLRIIIQSV
jgi:hypothetical protein